MAFIDTGSNLDVNQIGPGVGAGAGPLNILSNPTNTAGGVASLFGNNPNLLATLGLAGGVAGLGLAQAGQPLPFQGDLTGVVGQLDATAGQAGAASGKLFQYGSELINPLITGKLPAGADAEVQNFINQQTASTKSRYASLGQTGSTMETDALNNIQTGAAQLRFQIAQQMATSGLQATQESLTALGITTQAYGDTANIYQALMKAQMGENSSVLSAIGSFAGALGKAAAAAGPALAVAAV